MRFRTLWIKNWKLQNSRDSIFFSSCQFFFFFSKMRDKTIRFILAWHCMLDALVFQQRRSTGKRLVGSDSMIKRLSRVACVKGWFLFQEERKMELESCRRHFDTWRKLWGRPGHGAPIDHAHRNNLYNILYRPAIYWISTCRCRGKIRTASSAFFSRNGRNFCEISLCYGENCCRASNWL